MNYVMSPPSPALPAALIFTLLVRFAGGAEVPRPLPTITRAADVHSLRPDESRKRNPVRLSAIAAFDGRCRLAR